MCFGAEYQFVVVYIFLHNCELQTCVSTAVAHRGYVLIVYEKQSHNLIQKMCVFYQHSHIRSSDETVTEVVY